MPRWILVVLGLAALLLAAMPFDWVPGSYELGVSWGITAALVAGVVVAVKEQQAIWGALFAAAAVVLQPAFPIALGDYETPVQIAVAIAIAVCVVRNW
jgi:hypothetical protein